uniref:Putative methyltransferase n=1 Tax=viral metagenome TaxID=1070528 RepID=A0A6M3X571_9ZZZZ
MLIPARTDTAYFHNYILGKAEIRFIKGRLKFLDEAGKASMPAPFPSMVVIYRMRINDEEKLRK